MTGGDQDRWTKMGGHGARQILVYINLDQILRYMGRNKRLKNELPVRFVAMAAKRDEAVGPLHTTAMALQEPTCAVEYGGILHVR